MPVGARGTLGDKLIVDRAELHRDLPPLRLDRIALPLRLGEPPSQLVHRTRTIDRHAAAAHNDRRTRRLRRDETERDGRRAPHAAHTLALCPLQLVVEIGDRHL